MKNGILLILVTTILGVCAHAQDTTFAYPFKSGNILFTIGNKTGLLNRDSSVIIPCQYDALSDVRYGLIQAALNGKVGFIDVNNKVIIPFIYDEDKTVFIGARVYKVMNTDKDGNEKSYTLEIGIDKDYISFSNGLCAVIKNGKYGFIDTLGNTIIPFKFNGADNFTAEIAIVKIDKKYGAINTAGALVIPAIYNKLVVYDFERLLAEKDGEMFLIDFKGLRKKEDF